MNINTPINNNGLLPLPEDTALNGGILENVELNKFNRILTPITLQPQNTTTDDLELHMIYRQRLTRQYTQVLLRALDRMKKHVIPFDLYHPDYNQFIRHMDYRETIEQAHPSILKLEWQAVRHLLSAYGISEWSYRLPSMPQARPTFLPLPDQAHELIHHQYDRDDYKNALVQYFLMHSYMIGMRSPSELVSLKTTDIDLENNILVITEKKKGDKKRILALPETLMNSRWTKSLRNWIDTWRPKALNQYSGDALYLRPDGHPIKEMQVTNHILRRVQPQHPGYHLYISRHWCATALLIREYLQTGHWNIYAVKNHLGHENEHTTYNYVRFAEQYIKIAPYDWFSRILRNTVDPSKKGESPQVLSVGSVKTKRKQTHHRIQTGLADLVFVGISALGSILYLFFYFFDEMDDGKGGERRIDQGTLSEPYRMMWWPLILRDPAPDFIQASFDHKNCTDMEAEQGVFCFFILFLRTDVESHPGLCKVHPQQVYRTHNPECGVTSYSRNQACLSGSRPDAGINRLGEQKR